MDVQPCPGGFRAGHNIVGCWACSYYDQDGDRHRIIRYYNSEHRWRKYGAINHLAVTGSVTWGNYIHWFLTEAKREQWIRRQIDG